MSGKRSKKRTLKQKITIFVLLYIMILTLYFTASSLAKFIGTANGSGNIDVARWYVTANLDSNTINMVSGAGPQTFDIVVLSNSEVASSYSIVLTNVPNGLQVTLDSRDPITVSNNRVEFENAGSFETNETTSTTHTIKFEAPLEQAVEENTQINIDVVFVQEELD